MKIKLSTGIVELSSQEEIKDYAEKNADSISSNDSLILFKAKGELPKDTKGQKEFKKGDKVFIKHNAKELQRGVAWNSHGRMDCTQGTIATVLYKAGRNYKLSVFNDQSWKYSPECLERAELKKGDKVKIIFPNLPYSGDLSITGDMIRDRDNLKEVKFVNATEYILSDGWHYKREWLSLIEEEGQGEGGEPKEEEQEERERVEVEISADLGKLFGEKFKEFFDENAEKFTDGRLTEILKQEIQKLRPVVIQIPDRPEVKLEGRVHKAFEECLLLSQLEKQLFIAGPAGSGKTTLAEQLSKAMGLSFASISCSAGLSEAHLLGRMLFDGTYVSTDFVNLYENGGLFLFDEVDAADANTMLVINSALANGILSVPNRKDNATAKRHKDFVCIVSGNTWGGGSHEYHGRNHLDAAFLDRFAVSKVQIDYDKDLEKEIAGEYEDYANKIHDIREACISKKIRRVVSTRAIISGVRQLKAGKTKQEVLDRFFTGWSNEEKAKVLN